MADGGTVTTWTLLLAPTMRAVTVRAATQAEAVLAAPCKAGETVAVVLQRMER